MTKQSKMTGVAIAITLVAGLLLWGAQRGMLFGTRALGESAGPDPHAGHDHAKDDTDHDKDAPHDEKDADGEKHDEHAGHDHAKDDKDHAKAATHDEKDADGEKHDEHAGHDEEHADGAAHEEKDHGEKDGHDDEKDPHAGHDHGGEEGVVVRMTTAQAAKFGIVTVAAGPGVIPQRLRLPGEIVINADRSAHVVPTASGIVRKVTASVGDTVAAGDVLAIVESAELAEAKSDYLTKLNELSCCSMDLTRAETIQTNTAKLLKLLDSGPSLDQLQRMDPGDMGVNRASLVSAYAERVFTRDVYQRERTLAERQLSSKSDLLTAEAAYKKAHATYAAVRDSTSYATGKDLLEARRSRRNQEFAVKASGRKLALLGLTHCEMEALDKEIAPGAVSAGAGGKGGAGCTDPNCKECKPAAKVTPAPAKTGHDHVCTDPNCTDCKAHGAPGGEVDLSLEGRLGWYALRAPFAGTIIAKHMVLGEKLAGDADVFTIADMRTVWVDLDVYQKDLKDVRRGQGVGIHVGAREVPGTIAHVSPIVDAETRTCRARIVLANPKGLYRPGLFVTADVTVGEHRAAVLVPKSAVQVIEDEPVLFVPVEGGFQGERVTLGRSSPTHVEILKGLHAGEKYVVKGAFELKAEIVTSGIDPHAGHGH